MSEALLDRRRADALLVRGLLQPSPDIAEFVDYYWMVAWDMRGREPYVAAVLGELGLTKRSLQRLLHDYVGVGAKWIIRRSRLREAAERLDGEVRAKAGASLAALAASLGYFDQAHFGKDFKAMIGKTPQQYLCELREVP